MGSLWEGGGGGGEKVDGDCADQQVHFLVISFVGNTFLCKKEFLLNHYIHPG